MLTIKAFLHSFRIHTKTKSRIFEVVIVLRTQREFVLFLCRDSPTFQTPDKRFNFYATWSTIEMSKMQNLQKGKQPRDNACTEQK